jgi:hypothetical protein
MDCAKWHRHLALHALASSLLVLERPLAPASGWCVSSGPRREFGLLLQNIPDADAAKVAAFLRVGSARLRCAWKIVSEGQAHVLLSAGDQIDTLPGMFDGPVATLRLVDPTHADAAGPDALTRPLQYEALIEALARIEPAASRVGLPPAPPPAAATRPPTPAPAPAAPRRTRTFTVTANDGYRLRRWPPAALLGGHRYHMRLASFLATRHVRLDDLARLSNVSAIMCEDFLGTMAAADLLDIQPLAASTATPAGPAPVRGTAAVEVSSNDSLFARLRRRLGMS